MDRNEVETRNGSCKGLISPPAGNWANLLSVLSAESKASLLLLFFTLVSFHGKAQDYIYPLQILSEQEKSPIEMVSSDPEFVAWCLKSEFGRAKLEESQSDAPDDHNVTTLEWKDVTRKEWSPIPFSVLLTTTYPMFDAGLYHQDEVVPHIKIELKDTKGNDLLDSSSPSGPKIRQFLQTLLFQSHSYVSSANGINVRELPSIDAPVVDRLADYSRVIVKEKTNKYADVQKGGKIKKSEWVKVYVNEEVSGYVVTSFLIPPYAIHPSEIKTLNDQIKDYAEVEMIEQKDFVNKRIQNLYAIDRINIAIPASPPESCGSVSHQCQAFYLPINKGTDSLYFHDQRGEYGYRTKHYLGKIPVLNQYLVASEYIFGDLYSLYDIDSGTLKFESSGKPYISTDAQLILTENYSEDPESNPVRVYTSISINRKDSNHQFVHDLSISSKQLDFSIAKDGYWLSNTEILIKISTRNASFMGKNNETEGWEEQYFKLKIK